jgi:molybdopterin/thiamine biosynthesis adenylyltransferase
MALANEEKLIQVPHDAEADELQSRARAAGYVPDRLDAAALIAGVGAAGQNAALNLCLSGLREVRVVDGDRFEQHNATRSPGFPFGEEVVDVPKAYAVAAWLRRCATHVGPRVRWADAWIEDLGVAAFEGIDVVVSCVDSLRARAYLSDRCRELAIPLVEAGFGGPDVNVGIYPAPGDADEAGEFACWCCGREIHDEVVSCRMAAELAERAGIVPAIQTAAATVGGIQAEAAIQLLHGSEPVPRRIWFNIRTGESATARLVADRSCQGSHRVLPAPLDVDLDAAAPAARVLEAARRHLDGALELALRSPYVEREACVRCGSAIDVEAPGHIFVRAPLCLDHGGPYPRSEDGPRALSPVALIRPGDAKADLSCRRLGYAPGDSVVVRNREQEVVLRLAPESGGVFADTSSEGR